MTDARARFDRTELRPLWTELRRRLEGEAGPVRSVRVPLRTEGERQALADLLGLPRRPTDTVTVRVDRLDAVLGDVGLDVRAVVEAVFGSLRPLAEERREQAAARADLWAWLAGHADVAAEPALRAWADYVRRRGLVDDSPDATRSLLTRVFAVLRELPGDGGSLAEFAARVCADPHALDEGRLQGYVLRALACRYDEPVPVNAAERRALWQRAGIACDALSVSVLTAGLRPHGDSALAVSCRTWADAGQPARLTLAQVRATPSPPLLDAPHVWVVENPAVVAAAQDRFGPACPPMVCGSGWPNTAVIELLRLLGRPPRVHADLDGEGLRIAAYVLAKAGGLPWRMTAADYLAAVTDTGPPAGRVSDVPWDPDLAAAMCARGIAVHEERVINDLLADLASGR
jgi:uncharacterized protein (TIGR02679 family)